MERDEQVKDLKQITAAGTTAHAVAFLLLTVAATQAPIEILNVATPVASRL